MYSKLIYHFGIALLFGTLLVIIASVAFFRCALLPLAAAMFLFGVISIAVGGFPKLA